jgi:hypothetical protein
MFFVPVFALLSAIGRDPFAVSFTTLRDLCRPEFPLPASGLSFEEKSAKPHESCQALQNEHLQKWSHNSREMNAYEKIGGGRVLRSAEIAESRPEESDRISIPLHRQECLCYSISAGSADRRSRGPVRREAA